jgi:cobalt-zinc-cadmium efflux system outer membrane protein
MRHAITNNCLSDRNKNSRRRIALSVAFVMLVWVCHRPTVSALTLDQAVDRALADNLDLRAAYYNLEIGRGKLIQAGLWPNPELDFSGNTQRPFSNEKERTYSSDFTQAFPISGRLAKAKRVARVDLAQALMEIRNRERLLIGDVQKDFLTALILRRQIAARNEVKGVNQQFLEISAARLKKAEVSPVDVNLARTEVQRLQLENDLLQAELDARLISLRQKLGLAPDAPVTLEGDLDQLLARFSLTSAGFDPELRPDLRETELGIDRANAEIALARAEAWDDWHLGFGVEESRTLDNPTGLRTDRFAGLKLSVPLPLWNRNQGRVYSQRATADQAREQVQALVLTIRAEVATAAARARKLKEAAALYSRSILPLYNQNIQLLKQGFAQGLSEFSQMVQTQNQQVSLRITYLDAQTRYAEALVDLETAAATNPHLKKDFLQPVSDSGLQSKSDQVAPQQ